MQPLVLHLRSVLADLVKKLRIAHVLTLEENGPDVYEKVIASDLAKFEELTACKNFWSCTKSLPPSLMTGCRRAAAFREMQGSFRV